MEMRVARITPEYDSQRAKGLLSVIMPPLTWRTLSLPRRPHSGRRRKSPGTVKCGWDTHTSLVVVTTREVSIIIPTLQWGNRDSETLGNSLKLELEHRLI